MATIEPGSKVLARSAFDELLERRAVTGVQPGHDFPVVWVCPEEEWERANLEGREPEGLPWPAEHVQLAEGPVVRDDMRGVEEAESSERAAH